MTSLQMHLEPPVSGGRKYSRDGKSCQRIQTGHFDSFWTSDDIGQATLADTEMEVSSTSNSLPGENWIKKNSRRGLCHQYATVTQSHHHRRRTLSISTTWEPASGTAIPPQPREVTRLRSQHISLWIQNTEDYRTYHRIHRLHGIDRAHVQAWQANKIWKKWNCIHFHSDVYVFT